MRNAAFSWPLLGKFVFWSTVSHFHVNVDSNALKRKRGSPRGGGGGEDSRKRKRSQTRAQKCTPAYLRKNQKFFIASFLKGLVFDIDCSGRKESLFESSWKSKLWKRELVVFSRSWRPKIGNAQSLFFEWKQNFLKRDQNATTWKRGPVLAKRSGSTL